MALICPLHPHIIWLNHRVEVLSRYVDATLPVLGEEVFVSAVRNSSIDLIWWRWGAIRGSKPEPIAVDRFRDLPCSHSLVAVHPKGINYDFVEFFHLLPRS